MTHLQNGRINFGPVYPSVIGFDNLLDTFERRLQTPATKSYPPHNIVKHTDSEYEIQLAVAGFTKEDVTIEIKQTELVIKGEKKEDDSVNYIYKGIGLRSFEKTFLIAEHTQVVSAELKEGVLKIIINLVVPETLKPRLLEIA